MWCSWSTATQPAWQNNVTTMDPAALSPSWFMTGFIQCRSCAMIGWKAPVRNTRGQLITVYKDWFLAFLGYWICYISWQRWRILSSKLFTFVYLLQLPTPLAISWKGGFNLWVHHHGSHCSALQPRHRQPWRCNCSICAAGHTVGIQTIIVSSASLRL